jgi:hypothetical protein
VFLYGCVKKPIDVDLPCETTFLELAEEGRPPR